MCAYIVTFVKWQQPTVHGRKSKCMQCKYIKEVTKWVGSGPKFTCGLLGGQRWSYSEVHSAQHPHTSGPCHTFQPQEQCLQCTTRCIGCWTVVAHWVRCVCVHVYLHGVNAVCMLTEHLTSSGSRTGTITWSTAQVSPACVETNKSGEMQWKRKEDSNAHHGLQGSNVSMLYWHRTATRMHSVGETG